MKTRFVSLDDLIARTGVRRDELVTLAEIGALNAFGHDRRTALWQIERAVKKDVELLKKSGDGTQKIGKGARSPLPEMTPVERVGADYAGTGLTVGPHPMSFRRRELAMRGVLRATDLHRGRDGRRVRVAGAVITRQRPGTAKGFVFLTLEDETGVANIIVRPQIFTSQKLTILEQPFLLVEGQLQIQDGVTSVKAERCHGLWATGPDVASHDFH
jgi:error-prone DNA polymerase